MPGPTLSHFSRFEPTQTPGKPEWRVELVVADTAVITRVAEKISIETLIHPPLPDHSEPLKVAALQRARDLLNELIEEMNPPPAKKGSTKKEATKRK